MSTRQTNTSHRTNGTIERVLLTGVAGFIGSHLADRLLAEGCEVVGVDNFLTGRPENIEHLADDPRFEFIEADVAEPLDVHGDFDWVLHFASPASPPKYQQHPVSCMRANSDGTRHLLDLCRRTGAAFLLASTSEIYGDPEQHPQPESYRGNVSSTGPRAMYDEAKRYAEAITMVYRNSYGVDTRIIRIFNTYGPRMDPADGRVVSNFVCQALRGEPLTVYGDGSQTRSFQYVSDLIDGITRLMHSDYDEPVNLGNPQEFTIGELAELVAKLVPTAGRITYEPLPKDDPTRRRPDISCAREVLDWAPVVMLREGLEKTIPYFADQLRPVPEQPVSSEPSPAQPGL